MLFDSNVLIQYLNGDAAIVEQLTAWRREGRGFVVSSISIAEVLSLKNLSSRDVEKIKAFLETFVSVPFNDAIADLAARCRRIYGLGLPDAAIAATAMLLKLPLVTQDQQFKKIREITVIEI